MYPDMRATIDRYQSPSLLANPRWSQAGDRVDFPYEAIEGSVPARFEQIVERYADKTAVESDSTPLTYAQLNQYANRLAHGVTAALGDENEPVGFLVTHGASCVVAIFGLLKARKIYFALDPLNPTARLQSFFDDSGARLIITDDAHHSLAAELASAHGRGDVHILNLEHLDAHWADTNPSQVIAPDMPAAIYYTSGSTGLSKGSVHTHRSILHFAVTSTWSDRINDGDRQPLFYSCSYASSLGRIMTVLLNGATLFPVDLKALGISRLAEWLSVKRITTLFAIPSIFRQLLESLPDADPKRFADVRVVNLSGEVCTARDVESWKQHFAADCVLMLVLASTEALRIAASYLDQHSPIPDGLLPLGYA
ncbi:MAG: AMP-binding protein, partial [Chloroflexi bacterium]|nr:AMP-binding protein [Chloroflexota bacterium]